MPGFRVQNNLRRKTIKDRTELTCPVPLYKLSLFLKPSFLSILFSFRRIHSSALDQRSKFRINGHAPEKVNPAFPGHNLPAAF